MTRRQYWLAGVVAVAGLQIAVPVEGQPLAEVARLSRLARSQTTGPVRTFTQADLPPSVLLATRPRPAPTNRYRRLAEAALELERERLRTRRLRETHAPAPRRAVTHSEQEPKPRQDTTPAAGSSGGGIPLAMVYGSVTGPPVYFGQPVRRSRSGRTDGSERRTHPGEGRRGHGSPQTDNADTGTSLPESIPTPPAPARNGYAESSRPMHYVAPGIPVPHRQPRSIPRGR